MPDQTKTAAQKALELVAGMDTVNLDPDAAYPTSYAREALHAALLAPTDAEGIKHLQAAREYVEQALAVLNAAG